MRIFALSDVHVDYTINEQWIAGLSASDYRDDILILGGDVSDSLLLLEWCFMTLAARFNKVLYVPGNHDLWVFRDKVDITSLDKFHQVQQVSDRCNVWMRPLHWHGVSIVPLLSWYDYSFGNPTSELLETWMDYRACRWPNGFTVLDVVEYFSTLNSGALETSNDTVISFSHFVPRIDLMPNYVPKHKRVIYPILGSTRLEAQIRRLKPNIHVYGHSHINRNVSMDGVAYINNAFGYPQETRIAAKRLMCVYEI